MINYTLFCHWKQPSLGHINSEKYVQKLTSLLNTPLMSLMFHPLLFIIDVEKPTFTMGQKLCLCIHHP